MGYFQRGDPVAERWSHLPDGYPAAHRVLLRDVWDPHWGIAGEEVSVKGAKDSQPTDFSQLADSVGSRFSVEYSGCLPLSFSLVLFFAVLRISGKAFSLLLIEDTVNCKNARLALQFGGVASNSPL